jgi:hypothetical protein
VGLEFVLDESAAKGKAALADGAVEGQRSGGAQLAMLTIVLRAAKALAALTLIAQQKLRKKILPVLHLT